MPPSLMSMLLYHYSDRALVSFKKKKKKSLGVSMLGL